VSGTGSRVCGVNSGAGRVSGRGRGAAELFLDQLTVGAAVLVGAVTSVTTLVQARGTSALYGRRAGVCGVSTGAGGVSGGGNVSLGGVGLGVGVVLGNTESVRGLSVRVADVVRVAALSLSGLRDTSGRSLRTYLVCGV